MSFVCVVYIFRASGDDKREKETREKQRRKCRQSLWERLPQAAEYKEVHCKTVEQSSSAGLWLGSLLVSAKKKKSRIGAFFFFFIPLVVCVCVQPVSDERI